MHLYAKHQISLGYGAELADIMTRMNFIILTPQVRQLYIQKRQNDIAPFAHISSISSAASAID